MAGHRPRRQSMVQAYIKAGRAEDLANGVLWLLHRAGEWRETPPPPADPVLFGVHHPASDRVWDDAAAYLAWADDRFPERRGSAAVGLILDRNSWLNGETALLDVCVRHLEAAGLTPLPIFCDWEIGAALGAPGHPIRRLLEGCGPRLAAIWNAAIVHGKEDGGAGGPFAFHGVPVLQLLRHWSASAADWRASDEGLSPISLAFGLPRPEMMGCIDPGVVACSAGPRDGNAERVVEVLDDQVARMAGRTRAWLALRQKPNAEKRVAILLHNPPCKGLEATIGNASSLDALQSAVDLMHRLKADGYTVAEIPEDGKALLDRILAKKAISEFRGPTSPISSPRAVRWRK